MKIIIIFAQYIYSMEKKQITNDITRKEALQRMGKYAALTAVGTFLVLNPKTAHASSPPDPGAGFERPGNSANAPGHGATVPGKGGTPPGQVGKNKNQGIDWNKNK
ncbi:hypothetical protein MWU76_04595 [Gelidibacter sp. F2691]|nr:hypothetical protein [Gelidibacter sp. F2691]